MPLKDRILSAADIPREQMEVPEWGRVTVEVRGLSGECRARLLSEAFTAAGKPDLVRIYPRLCIYGVFDPETGERIFADGDEAAVNAKSGAVLERIAQAVMRLSGMTPEALELASKNLPAASVDSTSNSPSGSAVQ